MRGVERKRRERERWHGRVGIDATFTAQTTIAVFELSGAAES